MEKPYTERITSSGTSLLFLFLSILFWLLFGWRTTRGGFGFLPGLFACLGLIFALYTLNYRVLKITITSSQLLLKFGLISWKTRLDNIQACCLDDSPAYIRFGGAGVHFAAANGRYRVYFNFLEYPRVLVTFIKKQGPVQGLVFTTRQPDRVLDLLQSRTGHL